METDALVNGVLSFFIPGLGQAIEGYKMRGLILFIILIVLNGIFPIFPFRQNYSIYSFSHLQTNCRI